MIKITKAGTVITKQKSKVGTMSKSIAGQTKAKTQQAKAFNKTIVI